MIIDILQHTPVWVFGLLAVLVALGVQRLRARDVTPRRLFVLPVVMALLSAFGLYQSFGASAVAAAAWAVAIAGSLVVGRSLAPQEGVQYSTATGRIRIPGSRVPLALMMTIFFLRYVAAVSLALHPALRIDPAFVATIAFAYGLSSGAFAALALRTWKGTIGRSGDTGAVASAA